MYLIDTLYYLYKPVKRKDLLEISLKLSKEHKKNQIKIIADMVWCSLKYGASWTEYGDMDFFYRTSENRKTFITTFFNFRLYNKINEKGKRDIFHDKICFLEKFSKYIKRDWINVEKATEQELNKFFEKNPVIVAKASYGDSGKEVEVIETSRFETQNALRNYIEKQNFNLLEERIKNHEKINALNDSSLNTLRIVTVKNETEVNVLFAGIRVGEKGAAIDNISQGGKVARINIETGIIDSPFYSKRSSYTQYKGNDAKSNVEGFQIPMWDNVIDTVKSAALVVPEISIVAWDVAITENGIDLVEGNESFGSVIMQLYYNHDEEGLKPRLKQLI